MNKKMIGAILILFSCGWFGFSLSAAYRREEKHLRQMVAALDYMQCELQYRLTPLPELCRQAGKEYPGAVGNFLLNLSEELEKHGDADLDKCINCAFQSTSGLSSRVWKGFQLLTASLGRFDANGQISEMESVRQYCRRELNILAEGREGRLRSYQTLGLCAGAAIVILFV